MGRGRGVAILFFSRPPSPLDLPLHTDQPPTHTRHPQVLKILRYLAKFLLASRLDPASSSFTRAKAFEAAVADARKAYRLGKFCQGLNDLRRVDYASPSAPLAALAAGGDAAYYFLEQFTWLIRAGVLPKRYARRVARASAAAELLGYVGSASLAALRIAAASQREATLAATLAAVTSVDAAVSPHTDSPRARALDVELAAVAAARRGAERALLQDACDTVLALSDLTDGRFASSKSVLAVAGLTSAVLGARKVWGK